MICINHFSENDLLKATKSLPVRLRKGALPTIFNSIESKDSTGLKVSKSDDVADVTEITETVLIENNESHASHVNCENKNPIKCTNESCEYMRIKYEDLRDEHFRDEVNHQVTVSKMSNEIGRLKSIIENQTNKINSLSHQVTRAKESKNALSLLLKDLKHQKLLDEEASNALQV